MPRLWGSLSAGGFVAGLRTKMTNREPQTKTADASTTSYSYHVRGSLRAHIAERNTNRLRDRGHRTVHCEAGKRSDYAPGAVSGPAEANCGTRRRGTSR